MRPTIAIVASLLNLIGYVPYIRHIFSGKVRPHRVTWGIWMVLTAVVSVNQIVNGGGYSSMFFVSTTLLVTIVFVLSFKFGVGGASTLDQFCLMAAALLLIYWVTARDTRFSTLLALCIDTIAVIPTLHKTYKRPETESYPQWVLAGIAGLLTLFTVETLDWALLIYPAYVFVANGMIVATKFVRERAPAMPN